MSKLGGAISDNISKKKDGDKSDKADAKEQMLSEKLDWIRLKKKVTNISDLNPLTINIEQIYTLSPDIEVTDDGV